MTPKPRILLNWGYHRLGWLHGINAINSNFEFHFIFHLSKPVNEINHSKTNNIHYWSDFQSAQHLLNTIKPSKVIFMGLEGINSVALNIQAKKKGLETIILQHGMFHKYEDYLRLAKEEIEQRSKSNQSIEEVNIDKKFLFRFYLKSAWNTPGALFYMLRLQYWKRKVSEVEALKKVPSKYREASKYLVFTAHNASIYLERDNINPNKMVPFGNPEMDSYFQYKKENKEIDKFYLLVDQPWSEVKDFNSPGFGVTKESIIYFHLKLAAFAISKNARLKIKLHPYSYSSDFYPSHPDIDYLKDVEMHEFIHNAEGVFGFSSTLMQPAIYFNKCCLFRIWDESSFQNEIENLRIAQVLDYYNFLKSDIDFDSITKPKIGMDEFVDKFLFSTDGHAIKRLNNILKGDNDN